MYNESESKVNEEKKFKLTFKIISNTSEEEGYPVTELINHTPFSKGWQSKRNSGFPQEILIEFHGVTMIKQIEFLSHQYKISSKIELLTFDPTNNPTNSFKKIGYFTFSNNEKTNFQAREFKSIKIETKCQKLKIILHKPHLNVNNKSNQVGLISLNFFGESVKDSQEVNLEFPNNNNNNNPIKHGHTQSTHSKEDDFISKRIYSLNKAKEKALEMEDFDEAKNIKETIESLKGIGKDLVMLEARKLKAISEEDFDSAKMIKYEIEKIKNGVMGVKQTSQSNNSKSIQKSNTYNNTYNRNQVMDRNEDYENENEGYDNNEGYNNNNYNNTNYNNKIYNNSNNPRNYKQNQTQNQFNNNTLPTNQNPNKPQSNKNNTNNNNSNNTNTLNNLANTKQNEKIEKKQPEKIDVDKFIVKGIGDSFSKYVEQKMNDDPTDQQEDEEEEDIPEEEFRKAEPLIPFLGADLIKSLLSKNWKNKEKAIIYLIDDLNNQPNSELLQTISPDSAIVAIFGAATIAFDSKSSQLLISIMDMIIMAMEVFSNLNHLSSDNEVMFNQFCDSALHSMMEKVGDSNVKIREKAETASFEMAKCQVIGRDFVIKRLMEAQIKKQLVTSNKHLAGRLSLIGRIIESLTLNDTTIDTTKLLISAVNSYKAANKDVRDAAFLLIINIYPYFGESINQYIKDLRKNQIDSLVEQFEKIDMMNSPNQDNDPNINNNIKDEQNQNEDEEENDDNENDDIMKENNINIRESVKNIHPNKNLEEEENLRCQYCGIYDPNFNNDDFVAIHFFKYCPMFYCCDLCKQTIELLELNDHYKKECTYKSEFKVCNRCQEPVFVNDYDKHVNKKKCVPAASPSLATRCPLCHIDVEPEGRSGMEIHVLKDGCIGNKRSKMLNS